MRTIIPRGSLGAISVAGPLVPCGDLTTWLGRRRRGLDCGTGMATVLSFRGKLELRTEHSWRDTVSLLLHILYQHHGLIEGCRFDPWIEPSLQDPFPQKDNEVTAAYVIMKELHDFNN